MRRSLMTALVLSLAGSLSHAQAIVADHSRTNLSVIPDSAIAAAANLRVLVRRASVGGNISSGLTDLESSNAKYNRSRWAFEDRGNPGWQAKIDDFVSQVASRHASFDVMATKLCYIDPFASFEYYRSQMEALEANPANAGVRIVWWTIPIEAETYYWTDERQAFNDSVRAYAAAQGKVLFDIADIESHDASGTKITDASGYELLAPAWDYDGGHLNSAGSQRVASAWWWLMARLTGWNPGGTTPALSIGPATVGEGDSGLRTLTFEVRLSTP